MNVEAALRAVEGEVLELELQVSLHLQQLEPEHLRVDGDRMIASTGSLRFVDELIGLDGLLGYGPDDRGFRGRGPLGQTHVIRRITSTVSPLGEAH